MVLAQTGATERPTSIEQVPIAGVSVTPAFAATPFQVTLGHSCFAAGTPVFTAHGARRIESIETGELVLVRDEATCTLAERPVTAVFHNRPGRTLRIAFDTETITATPIHRFWVAGRGWVMARELKPGDPVRTLRGVARVDAISEGEVQPVYNLTVEEGRSFLVGEAGLMVHDNSLVDPVAPFDAVAGLE
jgi:hypothetical protein